MKKIVLVSLVFFFLNIFVRPSQVHAVGASLLLSPATYSAVVGTTFTVDILVDTGGVATTNHIKAVITFDTSKLQVVDADAATVGTQIKAGPIISSLPSINSVDAVTGKITYDTGVISPAYSGHGTLATITFKALAAGITRPPFDFTNSSITSPDGSNILEVVNDGTYTLGASGAGTTTDTTTTTTTTSDTTTTLPQTGVVEDTLMVVGLGVFLIFGSWVLRRKVV